MTTTVGQTARRAHQSEATDKGARLGFAGTGLLHVVVAVLVLLVAVGRGGGQTDQQGALRALADQPGGKALLLVVALGFAGYAVWRALEAAVDRRRSSGKERIGKRVASGALALAYTVLCGSTLRVALGGGSSNTEQQSDSATAAALSLPGGRWLVGFVGLAGVVGGVLAARHGLKRDFREHLEGDLRGGPFHAVVVLGIVGWVARGALLALLGSFLVKAALESDADEARGLDGALQELAAQPFGKGLLVLVALGLLSYGLFCFAQVKWRHTQT